MLTGQNYALLWTPTANDADTTVRQLTQELTSWRGKISDLIDPIEVGHWKQALGTFAWRFVDKEGRLVFTSAASASPGNADADSKQLVSKVQLARIAMLLAAPTRPYWEDPGDQAVCVSGEANTNIAPVQLKTIRGVEQLTRIVRPAYDSQPAFGAVLPFTKPDLYIDRWEHWVRVLDTLPSQTPPILAVAFKAFEAALTRRELEFAVPEFVRTAECIVGLPPQKGGHVFADRVMRLARGVLNTHWYVGGNNVQDRLVELYDHRSACVHGKIPFETLQRQGVAGVNDAARHGYLAEATARECLSFVLQKQQHFVHFKDRDTLQNAWANNLMP